MTTKFPIFASYINLSDSPIESEVPHIPQDPYWKKVFESCSKGRFPRKSGFDSTNNSVWFREGKNIHWYKLTGDDEKDFIEIKRHFRDYLKLRSEKDRTENRDQFNRLKEELDKSYTGGWKNIKKKNIKDSIIRQYILKLQSDNNLSDEKTIELSKDIRQAFLFGWITSDNMKYEDRQIQNITNLSFNDEGEYFIDPVTTKAKREYSAPKIFLSALWKKK